MLTTSTCIIIGDIAMKIDCTAKKLFVDVCIYAYIYINWKIDILMTKKKVNLWQKNKTGEGFL